MYWDDGTHMGDGWGVVMMLGMLLFWVMLTTGVVLAIVWILRSTRPTAASSSASGPAPPATTSAEQILAERLARGEIDTEEYRARVEALTP